MSLHSFIQNKFPFCLTEYRNWKRALAKNNNNNKQHETYILKIKKKGNFKKA